VSDPPFFLFYFKDHSLRGSSKKRHHFLAVLQVRHAIIAGQNLTLHPQALIILGCATQVGGICLRPA